MSHSRYPDSELTTLNKKDVISGYTNEAVIQALEKNLWEMWANFGRAPGCRLHEQQDAMWFETPIPTMPYNMVLRFSVTEEVERRIDEIVAQYRKRGVVFMWIVHPTARPADLAQRLADRGLQEVELMPGMALNLADLPEPEPAPEGFEIHEVTGKRETGQVFELIAWRWHVPPEAIDHLNRLNDQFKVGTPAAKVRCWLAWQGGSPVAKVVLYNGQRTAGLYGVVTKPEARRLGLARLLTLTACQAAREDGQSLAVLHSSPMAESLYAKIGFRTAANFRLFASTEVHI